MCLNYIGIKESSNFNIVLSVVSIISEIALLFIGFFIVWNFQYLCAAISHRSACRVA